MMACAEACRTSAHFILIGSELHKRTCRLCSEICEQCAADCERIGESFIECFLWWQKLDSATHFPKMSLLRQWLSLLFEQGEAMQAIEKSPLLTRLQFASRCIFSKSPCIFLKAGNFHPRDGFARDWLVSHKLFILLRFVSFRLRRNSSDMAAGYA